MNKTIVKVPFTLGIRNTQEENEIRNNGFYIFPRLEHTVYTNLYDVINIEERIKQITK